MASKRSKSFVAVILAIAALTTACKSDKKSASSTKTTTPSEHQVQLGIATQGKGNLDAALVNYRKAIELDPTNKFAYYDVGVVLQARQDVTGASNAYEKALDIDPKYRPALYNLAILREPLAPDSSEALYNRILAITPNDANVLLHLGLLQRKLGKTVDAQSNLSKAVSIDPKLQTQIDARATTGSTTTTK